MFKKFTFKLLAASALVGIGLGLGAAGLYTNGIALMGPLPLYSHLSNRALVPVDTQLAGGAAPQTVGVETARINFPGVEQYFNTATSTAGAATLNTAGGTITTEALTTAPGATYTFTLTDSMITTATQLMVDIYSKSNTATGAAMQLQSVTPAAGSAVIVFVNNGTAALNGTMLIPFHI